MNGRKFDKDKVENWFRVATGKEAHNDIIAISEDYDIMLNERDMYVFHKDITISIPYEDITFILPMTDEKRVAIGVGDLTIIHLKGVVTR